MSQNLTVQQRFDAACGLVGGTAVSPAGNWTSGTAYTLLLVAWDDPDEIDITRCRCINGPSPFDGTRMYDSVVTITPGASNLSLTVSWTPPQRPPKSHYSIYQQTASSYTRGNAAQKVLPQSSERVKGNIAPWATSATLDSKTTIAQKYGAQVDSIDTGANTYTIRGNWIAHIIVGTVIRPNDSANQTVNSVSLVYSSNGVQTLVGVSTSVNASATYIAVQTTTLYYPASTYGIFKSIFNPVDAFSLTPRERTIADTSGLINERTLVNNSVFTFGQFDVNWLAGEWQGNNQTGTGATSIYQMNDYANKLIPVEIIANTDSTNIRAYKVWRGMLKPASTTGLGGMHNAPAITLAFDCDTTIDATDNMRWFDVNANTSSSFTIDGDWTATFYEGRRFYVNNSTAQDGLYATSSSAYTAATNITVITVTVSTISGTDGNGRIELWQ